MNKAAEPKMFLFHLYHKTANLKSNYINTDCNGVKIHTGNLIHLLTFPISILLVPGKQVQQIIRQSGYFLSFVELNNKVEHVLWGEGVLSGQACGPLSHVTE